MQMLSRSGIASDKMIANFHPERFNRPLHFQKNANRFYSVLQNTVFSTMFLTRETFEIKSNEFGIS